MRTEPTKSIILQVCSWDEQVKLTHSTAEVGRHVVTIKLTGHNISGSPFNVPVTRSVADSKYCKGKFHGIFFETR